MDSCKSGFKKFLFLWLGELISSIGGGLTSFGLAVYVFNETGSAASMAVVSLLAFLPTLILSVLVIYCIILLFAKKLLKQMKTKTIVDLLVLEDGFSKKVKVKSRLYKSGKLSTNALIGMQEVRNGYMVNIISDNQTYCMEVCGIYQDVTSGGKTAKTIYDFEGELSEKYTYQLELSNDIATEVFSNNLKSGLESGYSIKSMDSFLEQTLGGVTVRFSQAVYLVIIIGMIITSFIMLLYMELRLARTMHVLAGKIAMGIPIKAICMQELYPMFFTGCTGIVLGIVLTELLGEKIVSALFSLLGLGITSISFSTMTISCILVPVSLVIILVVISLSVCMKVKKIDITEYFNQ